jgi:3-methyl-2-oxobutanoate hydroxymethyltransferase
VCAHLGLTPQSVHQLGGYRVQGREASGAERLQHDAKVLQDAGASLLVLEAVPSELAAAITQSLAIPTIGIGAGVGCDGQVLVLQDMLGIYPRPSPKFSKNFMQGAASVEDAVKAYVAAVKSGAFPGPEHSFHSA